MSVYNCVSHIACLYPEKISLVTPSIPKDINKVLKCADIFFEYLPVKNIFIVGPEVIYERISQENNSRLIFIDEQELCNVNRIRQLNNSRTKSYPDRANWYVQQFIKMAFSRYTDDEYYLIWDSDTIPLKHTKLFSDDMKPVFDMKTEYHKPYFDTISRILPGVEKVVDRSFISEHMLIRTEYMRNMLNEIEANNDVKGSDFQEKIINAANVKDLPYSGFSEYETYGSYVMTKHKDSYILREWYSMRSGKYFYSRISQIDERNRKWLAENYDAITLERYHRTKLYAFILRSKIFQRFFDSSVLNKL